MSEPDSDRALLEIAHELDAVGRRLTALSAALVAQRTPPSDSREAPEPAQPSALPADSRSAPEPAEREAEPVQGEGVAAQHDVEPDSRWAENRVLAWVGGAVTLVGMVFLLVMAVQGGWLSPVFRVVGGLLLGVALVGTGAWAHRRPEGGTAGNAVAATGFAVLYLDAVAATSLYEYFPVTGGLGAGLLVAAGGLLLADRWRAQPLAVGVVVGCAMCAPLITQRPSAVLVGFLLLLQIVAAPVHLRRGWRALSVLSSIPAVAAALVGNAWGLMLPEQRAAVVAASGAVAVVGVGIAIPAARYRPTQVSSAIGVLVSAPIPALLAAPLLDRVEAGYLAAGVAVLFLAVWGAARFTTSLSSRVVATAGGVGAVAALQATMTFLDSSLWASVLLGQALLLSSAALRLRSWGPLAGALPYAFIGFCVALTDDLAPDLLFDESGSQGTGIPGVLVGLLVAAVVVVVPAIAVRLGVLPTFPRARAVWMSAGVVLLYAAAGTTMALVLLVSDDRAGFLVGHVLITLSWVLAAIALLLRGVGTRYLRGAGTVLLAVALAKLFLFDLATLDGFARVVAFLCAGLVLLTAGLRYARLVARFERDHEEGVQPADSDTR